MTSIGELRHRIVLQDFTETPDAAGQRIPTWSDVVTLPASIVPISGSESIQANQQQAVGTHKITIRYISGVTPAKRFNFGGRIFNIIDARLIDERQFWIECLCVEKQS